MQILCPDGYWNGLLLAGAFVVVTKWDGRVHFKLVNIKILSVDADTEIGMYVLSPESVFHS